MKKFITAATLLTAAVVISSCSGDKKDAAQQDAKPQVKIETVSAQSIPQTETFTATVESDIKNNISPNAPYRIERILVDVGDVVRQGQVLVQLDASSANQSQIQIENQKLAIENARLAMQNQEVEFGRVSSLYNIGGASKSEYDSAKLRYDQARIAYDNARKQLNITETQYRQTARNTQLTAPVSGVVTARNYDNGDMFGQLPILTIEQTNPVKLVVNISETHYQEIAKGMPVDITLDAYGNETFSGSVTIVYPSINATTHTFPVEITISNPKQKVRPGMFARATINYGDANHVIVPDVAIVKQIGAGDRYVYVYKDGKVSYNKVELGRQIGDKIEIISGVNSGDQVVIAGQTKLANGREVEVVK